LPRSEIKRSTVASRVENEMATGRQAREREREREGEEEERADTKARGTRRGRKN